MKCSARQSGVNQVRDNPGEHVAAMVSCKGRDQDQ